MKVSTMAALAMGVLALAACSTGRRANERPERLNVLMSSDSIMFAMFDTDGDFQTSTAEIEAGVAQEWTRADANGDGSLTPIEYQNWSNLILGGGQLPPYRLDFDRNVDNVITQDEFRTEIMARAQEYNSDENGLLTRGEFVRNLNTVRPGQNGPPTWRAQPAPDGTDRRR